MLGSLNVEARNLWALLRAHYQLIGVLIGVFLVLVSTGIYTNWDAQLEFEAASNVVNRGFPYVSSGFMINQPPLGFYLDAPVFHLFGLSYENGVGFVGLFGLGCVVLVYVLGLLLYGKLTGLVAAALFGMVPWQVYMSRIFLIDVKCLFFSLFFLILGILAVRRNSEKLALFCGVAFAAALMTKLFAVLLLVPLLLIIFLQRKESVFRLSLRKVAIFLVPALVMHVVWYGIFAPQNFFAVYFSTDFSHPVLIDNPSLTFLPRLLVGSLGWFLLIAVGFSLALSFAYKELFSRITRIDALCVVTILAVAGLDLLFVFGFHLLVPYVSAFKYNYFALPFFCLLAASLAGKSVLLVQSKNLKSWSGKFKLVLVGLSLFLLLTCLVESLAFLLEWDGFVAFEVDSAGHYFPFNLFSAPPESFFHVFHYAAVAVIVVSLLFPLIARGFRRVLWRVR
ncbi:MAG: glycosyltransferase family 39 protein [Candidatus Bathyarchaeota archaeon]|nr:glycosyltransferase family 39 protein [Candidatus Bathyarchaeota archaeon]